MNIYEQRKTQAMIGIPQEFVSYIESVAYDRGHSAGQDEVDMIAAGMATDLKPVIEAYTKRIKA